MAENTANLWQKIQHLQLIINRSDYNNANRLQPSKRWINEDLPTDYNLWNDDQRHQLEVLVNAVSNTVQLINERV